MVVEFLHGFASEERAVPQQADNVVHVGKCLDGGQHRMGSAGRFFHYCGHELAIHAELFGQIDHGGADNDDDVIGIDSLPGPNDALHNGHASHRVDVLGRRRFHTLTIACCQNGNGNGDRLAADIRLICHDGESLPILRVCRRLWLADQDSNLE